MQRFNFYEIAGIVLPGLFFGLGVAFLFFPTGKVIAAASVGVGGGLVVVLLAYLVGFAIKEVGAILAAGWWKIQGGLPTDWIFTNDERLLSAEQRAQLRSRGPEVLPVPEPNEEGEFPEEALGDIRRQMYAFIEGEGQTDRVDRFGGNYAMHRNLLAASVLLAVVYLIEFGLVWTRGLPVLIGFLFLSGMGMQSSAQDYAEEICTQFLDATAVSGGASEDGVPRA